ncbi:unnamed protein product [Ostreobium quekettii]|uniref:TFIIS N-terminal domain-containing protein n=1 Tax=Ostreobium quekettii TaxID=121088 RepID=A0A8S1ITG2_9CHLO|nr:unnamed protein product [Ostreobium quekettii]|eukprot:evm.model.scf_1323.1 EVM.evm.TU.scf_1323.1   scf_1323:1056-3416(-)
MAEAGDVESARKDEGMRGGLPSPSDICSPRCGAPTWPGLPAGAVPSAVGRADGREASCSGKRRRAERINSGAGARSMKRRRLEEEPENAPSAGADLYGDDLWLPGGPGPNDCGCDCCDVPVLLHPHTPELCNLFFDRSDPAGGKVLRVLPPTADAVRLTADNHDFAKIGALGDARGEGMPEDVRGVLFGDGSQDKDSDGDPWNPIPLDGRDGHRVPIRGALSCAWLPINNRDRDEKPSVVKHVPVGSKWSPSFVPPPAVEQAPAPTVGAPDRRSESHVAVPGVALAKFKAFRTVGTLGSASEPEREGKKAAAGVEDRVLVPVDRDPARTNGAMALLTAGQAGGETHNEMGSDKGVERRRRCVVNVRTVPLVVEARGRGRRGRQAAARADLVVPKAVGVRTSPAAGRRKPCTVALQKEQSSENTITDQGCASSETISNRQGRVPHSVAQSRMQDGTSSVRAEVINMSIVSEAMPMHLIKMDVCLNAAIAGQDASRILLILDRLMSLQLSFAHLVQSGIGETVTALRSHWHPDVVSSATVLVKRWRWMVQQNWQQKHLQPRSRGGRVHQSNARCRASAQELCDDPALDEIALHLQFVLEDLECDQT